MNNNTRKIVVLNNLDSPKIEQAIFILREEIQISEHDAVYEAQRIVDLYAKSLSTPSAEAKKPRPRAGFLFGMALYTILTVVMTAYLVALK